MLCVQTVFRFPASQETDSQVGSTVPLKTHEAPTVGGEGPVFLPEDSRQAVSV